MTDTVTKSMRQRCAKVDLGSIGFVGGVIRINVKQEL